MANSKITNLTALTAATGDELPINRAGADGKVNAEDVAALALPVDLASEVTGTLPVANGGTGATTAAGARTNLDVDQAGTDNSTDVTLAGSLDYLTISGQEITRNAVDLSTDVTGTLPVGNVETGTSGTKIPLLDGANTWSALQTFSDIQIGDATIGVFYDATNDLLSIGADEQTMTVAGSAINSKFSVHAEGAVAINEWHTHSTGAGLLDGPVVYGARSDGTEASPTVVVNNDYLLSLAATGYDGTDYAQAARIDFQVDGTPGSNDMPGRIVFSVSPDGGQSPAEAFRISNDKTAQFQGTVTFTAAGVQVGSSVPFSDSSGTLTLQNVDALDATTETTIEGAIDTLDNLTSVQGLPVSLADAAANAIFGWNDGNSQYENLTSAEATAVLDAMVGDSGAGGTKGLVPAPSAGDSTKFLKGDGTWAAGGSGAPTDATYIVQTANGTLTNEQALGALATGIVKNTTTTGVLSIAAEGTDYYGPGGTDVAIADGGTGASTASAAVGGLVSALTADTSPDGTADYVGTYDNSATTGKKVLLNRLPVTTRDSVQATTSGTAFDFTIPSSVRKITIAFDGVSVSGTDNILVRIGDAGGIETTGYAGLGLRVANGSIVAGSSATDGFNIGTALDAYVYDGRMTLTNVTGNVWVADHTGYMTTSAIGIGGGTKTLSAELTTVRITRTGSNTFDAGQVNVLYHY